MTYHLAVDIGASSGRHILGHLENGRMVLEEVYRFDNIQQRKNGHDCWDVEALWDHILAGLCACRAAGKIPVSMGIDTWAVDFVLLDAGGNLASDAVAYRDARTEGVRDRLEAEGVLSFADHYARAGIQYQPFNTAYQLAALKDEHPEQLERAQRLLMIPEYFNYLLTGKMVNEYTNASSTALVNAEKKTWDDELIAALGLPRKIFGELHMPGASVGHFTPAVQQIAGFDCEVLLPATHDTASAFLAVPARDDSAVYISSGTWSLLGVENFSPITTPESRAANFTNEGGYNYRFRYLKNIMGLWMIQSVRREWNGVAYVAGKQQRTAAEKQWSYAELETEARACEDFAGRVDVNDARFLSPASMVEEVKAACVEAGGPVPQTVGEVMACIYHSLADCYAAAIRQLQNLTGKTYTAIHIVGGGSKDGYLNALTARAAGLPVFAGPTEGTALGNLMVQMIAAGEFVDLAAARAAIHTSFPITEVQP
ncbi:rhamnulokinase [Anaerofilum sp. An201]|nr:rhamnulokinase [Anaerofilum sp. An201]OUP05153.1 rhamnulokinase [Anaerofilum sp. An201]